MGEDADLGGAMSEASQSDTHFLDQAIALSREKMRAGEGGPFAAVVVVDGEVVAEGWNRVTSANDPTAHAEVEAIRAACDALDTFSLDGATVYVNCEPCPMCLSAMYWARVSRVVYANTREDAAGIGFDDALIYRELSLSSEQRSLASEHRPSAAALDVFSEWVQMDDKTPY